MKNTELEQLINEKLNSAAISDYAPNGLQVEGKETVQKIVTGVTASQALLDEAVRLGADAVITVVFRDIHRFDALIANGDRPFNGAAG